MARKADLFESIYKFPNGDASSIFVNNNTPNAITLTDMKNRNATVNLTQSNRLSNRCTIHLINNYLQYN